MFTVCTLIDNESWLCKKIIKVRVKTMQSMEQGPIFVKGFTILNGDLLVFTTNKKVYAYVWLLKIVWEYKVANINVNPKFVLLQMEHFRVNSK